MCETITNKQLSRIMKTALNLNCCPCCSSNVDIVLKLQRFGAETLSITCPNCGYTQTSLPSFHSHYITETKFATPLTFRSLTKGIFQAVYLWNKEAQKLKEAENGHDTRMELDCQYIAIE